LHYCTTHICYVLNAILMERYHLQILEVQAKGVKVHGPLTPTLAVDCITRLLKDQPLAHVGESCRVWVVDLDTGEIKRPTLKLHI
jgi:hypothetical protein